MKHNKRPAALVLAFMITLLASCSEPTVIANTLGTAAESTPAETTTTTAATTFETTTTAVTTTAETTTTAYHGGDGMVPNPENEKKYASLDRVLDETNSIVFDSTETLKTGVAATGEKNGDTCDIYVFRESGAELLFSLPRSAALTEMTHYSADGLDFLIIYEKGAMGRGYPATVITIKDDEPLVLSKYVRDSGEWPELFYLPSADLICMRSAGVTIGSNSVIPYHWNGEAFVPYDVWQISVPELKELDTSSIVLNPEGAVSIYRRENGLVHVNYLEYSDITEAQPGITASMTYVYENGKLRVYDYDSDKDLKYGFFPEALPVTSEPIAGSQSGGI